MASTDDNVGSSATNPYEAPRSPLKAVVSNSKLDQMVAERMLEARDLGGYSLRLFLRWNAKRYFLSLVFFATILSWCVWWGIGWLFLFLLGLFVGIMARDFGWFTASIKVWPFNERVIDWDKVRQIADGEL